MKRPRAVKLFPHAAGILRAVEYIGGVPNVNEILTAYDRGLLAGLRMGLADAAGKPCAIWSSECRVLIEAIRAAEARRGVK